MATLTRVLGELVWKSIGFYFDPKALSRDPEALTDVLNRLFGRTANVLEKVIAEDILAKVGVPEDSRRGSDFRGFIRTAKAKFVSSVSNISSTVSNR